MLALWSVLTLSAAAAEVPRWQLSGSTDRIAWLASVAWIGSKAQTVDLQWRPPIQGRHDIELGLTGRLVSTPVLRDGAGKELGVRLAYAPVSGAYQPSMGLEAGYSGGVYFDWASYFGAGWQEKDPVYRADYAPVYVGAVCEPLRFGFGHLSVSSLGLSLGQMGLGRVVRTRVSLIGMGARF